MLAVLIALGALVLLAGIGVIYFGGHKPEPKYVMIHFDDGRKSQYDFATPILDRYGFKGSFWIVCNYAEGTGSGYMNWDQIDDLVARGHDIQNHGMSHARHPTLTDEQLAIEIGDCKEKLMQHGSTGEAYAIPFNDGSNDERIVTVISQFHNYAKGGGGAPQLANCSVSGCEITKPDGRFNENSRYAMRQWSHDNFVRDKTEQQVMDGFINAVNLGQVDSNGGLVQISIITYHRINESAGGPSLELFEAEMKYLAENGFITLGMDDITYNKSTGRFELR
jgi:peptidoglycan/xylan/chitin deacetylase (PgdA/CDA1 family)